MMVIESRGIPQVGRDVCDREEVKFQVMNPLYELAESETLEVKTQYVDDPGESSDLRDGGKASVRQGRTREMEIKFQCRGATKVQRAGHLRMTDRLVVRHRVEKPRNLRSVAEVGKRKLVDVIEKPPLKCGEEFH